MDHTTSAKRLIIAVDCDDVLVRTTPFLVDAYNKLYGTKASLDQAHSTAFEVWQADEALQTERWKKLIEVEGYKELGPNAEEAYILHELASRHELHLVTARREEERAFTRELLNREFAGVFTSMEFVGWAGSKGEVCKRIGADVLIDDNARHLHDAIGMGLPKTGAILFGDYAWNAIDSTNSDLIHCLDWPAVLAAVQLIESRK